MSSIEAGLAPSESAEKGFVVSEALLWGILQAHRGTSEPEQLVKHFGMSSTDLLRDLEASGFKFQETPAMKPVELRELPELSTNTQVVMDRALALAAELNQKEDGLVRLRDLFGGILTTESSVAYQVMARAMERSPVSIDEIKKTYPDFLGWDSSREYSDFLAERFPVVLDVKPRAISDMPTGEDALGFGPLVDGLDALFNDKDTKLPLAVAVTAPWGMGKSSVMMQLEKRLQKGKAPPGRSRRRWYTVRFPAWRYEKSERLWAALARAVYDQPQKPEQMRMWERIRFRIALQRRRLGLVSFLSVGAVPVGAAVAGGLIFVLGPTDWAGAISTGGSGVLAGVASRWWGVVGAPFKRSLQAYVAHPKYQEQLGFTDEAHADIGHLMRSLTSSGDCALAIFVDDLDRCSPRHVVEVIEAINQIFNSEDERRCVFILGMDREVVAASIDVEYKDTVGHLKERESPLADDYGLRFLSKLVQMSVAIPPPDEGAMRGLLGTITDGAAPAGVGSPAPQSELVDGFVEQFRRETPANPIDVRRIRMKAEATTPELDEARRSAMKEAERLLRGELFTNDSEDVREAEIAVIDLGLLGSNPRRLKRFDNAFRLQLYVANRTPGNTLDFSRDELVALAKWVALRLRWPQLAHDLDTEPGLLSALEGCANNGTAAKAELVKRYKRWFSQDDLRRALKVEGSQKTLADLPFDSFLRVA